MQVVLIFLFALLCYDSLSAGLIVEPRTDNEGNEDTENNITVAKPHMYHLHVDSEIRFRFAHTVISSRIANPANISQEVSFSAVLPKTAFISGFLMVVDDHVYNAYVREKEVANQEYAQAVKEGATAAHVALSARDSNRFTVSVNVEPHKKVTFNLTYVELLSRTLGAYKHVINLDPGQIVPDLRVAVRVEESRDITTLNVPALRVSNEIDADPATGANNSLATIERPTPQSAVVKFAPTPDQQRELAEHGIKGQLIVEYDVNRTEHPGEVLVNDGYFVHFFSPADLPPLRKQVTFVLDVSGSMGGRKIEQLRQAMTTILGDLNQGDLFSIVLFSSSVLVWNSALTAAQMQENIGRLRGHAWGYPVQEEPNFETLSPSVIATATPENIAKAKVFVEQLTSLGATNINGALMKALEISKLSHNSSSEDTNSLAEKPEPIIIFLTDGQPNVGGSDPNAIVTSVTAANTGNSSIFSLALGNDADLGFLKKLSLRNTGFARKIYEASDTALQLRDFYRQLASPLLANVTFKYSPEQVQTDSVTKQVFRRLFSGSELVVAGRLSGDNVTGEVEARKSSGLTNYLFDPIFLPVPPHSPTTNTTPSTMERLWAYLTIQQLLEEDETKDYDRNDKNYTSPEKQRALEIALTYSFVTTLTSLVVVKPNDTNSVDTEDASDPGRPSYLAGVGYAGRAGYFSKPGGALPTFALAMLPLPRPPMLPTPGITLGNLSDVTWLSSNDTEISLPIGDNGTPEVLQLAAANETNVEHSQCTTPNQQPGQCRHFRYCVLQVFQTSKSQFLPYFCRIDSWHLKKLLRKQHVSIVERDAAGKMKTLLLILLIPTPRKLYLNCLVLISTQFQMLKLVWNGSIGTLLFCLLHSK